MKGTLGVLIAAMLFLPLVSGALVIEGKGYELHLKPVGNYHVGYATTFWTGRGQPFYGVFLKVSGDGKLEWAYNYSSEGEVIFSRALPVGDGFLLIGGARF